VPVPQLVNYRYTVVQLRTKRSLLHRNNIRIYTPVRPTSNFLLSFRKIFQFQFWPHRRYCHMSFWVSYCGNMTSYRFFKMAAAVAQYYFRFRICWCPWRQKVKIYQQTKFRRHISIDGWYLTTSVFEKQTSAVSEIGIGSFIAVYWEPAAGNRERLLLDLTQTRVQVRPVDGFLRAIA